MGSLLPGLPDDLALLVLARLPRALHDRLRCVSRAWKAVLHGDTSAVAALRASLHISESWLLVHSWIDSSGDSQWCVMDPLLLGRHCNIPLPPHHLPASHHHKYHILSTHVGILVLLALPSCPHHATETAHLQRVYFFDAFRMEWLPDSAPLMHVKRLDFAWAASDDYVYIAGGGYSLKSVERLDVRSKSWERLPDMWHEREDASAVVLDGCLYVIGGSDGGEYNYSGEIWNPITGNWTLVPELWPSDIFRDLAWLQTPSITTSNGMLYALSDIKQEILYYEAATKTWTTLCPIPLMEMYIDVHSHLFDIQKVFVAVAGKFWLAFGDCRLPDDFFTALILTADVPTTVNENMMLTWKPVPLACSFSHVIAGLHVVQV